MFHVKQIDKERLMELAYKEALKAYKEDEVPVGAVLVDKDLNVISKAHNQKEKKNNSLYHAEIICINKACKKLNTKYLNDYYLFVTLEPCLMCTGYIVNSRIKKVYYATSDNKSGSIKSILDIKTIKTNHSFDSEEGILKDKCSLLLKEFFKNKR